jgi:Uma2 family endonuclease
MATVEIETPVVMGDSPAPVYVAEGRRLFTVDEYALMGAKGVLRPDERTELIGGEVRLKNAMGPLHAELVRRLTVELIRQAGSHAAISPQCPFVLDELSQPEPDLALLRNRGNEYAANHPRAQDVLLLIEVSDTTLKFDREEKLPRYAKAGIPEIWLVDVDQQQIEQYSQPNQGVYEKKGVRKINDEIQSLGSPTISLAVMGLFA